MAGVSVKMGVTGVATFKRNIGDAEAKIKALNAALKLNESQLKLTGNQETYMSNKVKILKDRINAQIQVVREAEKALKAMKDKGVNPASKEFQDMQTKVYQAATKLTNMKTELKNVETNSGKAATGLNKTNESLKSLNKAKAWDNVADGIGKVTKTLEQGARAAINFGNKIMGSVKESTGWADELLTLSAQTDIDVETLQKMEHLAEIVDTEVDAIITAKKRMSKAAAGDGAKDIKELFGIDVAGKDPEDLFWDLGEALLGMGEAFDKEAAAQKVFGRNWNELLPLFKLGRTEYEKMLNEQTYLTEEQVQNLGNADDKIKQFEQQIAQMKNEFWSENADKITELLQWLMDNKDGVYNALAVIAAGFGLLKIGVFAANMGKVLNGFKELGLLGGGTAAANGVGTTAAASGTFWSNVGTLATHAIGAMMLYPTVDKLLREGVDLSNPFSAGKSYEDTQKKVLDIMSPGMGYLYEKAMNPGKAEPITFGQSYRFGANLDEEAIFHRDRRSGTEFQSGEVIDGRVANAMDRMNTLIGETNQTNRTIAQNSLTPADINAFTGLPAQISAAVRSGMSGVTIIINDSAVSAIGRKVGSSMARGVQALLN